MDTLEKDETISQMVQIGEIVDTKLDRATQSRESIDFFKDLTIGNSGLAEQNIYVVKIANQNKKSNGKTKGEQSDNIDALEKYPSYEIYNKNHNLIATVNKEGKVQFTKDYIAEIQKKYGSLAKGLNLEDASFHLLEELTSKELSLSKEELSAYKENKESKGQEKEEESKENKWQEKERESQKTKGNGKEKSPQQENEEEKREKTAKVLGIKSEDIKAVSTIDPNQKVTDKETLRDIMPEAGKYKELQISLTNPTQKSNGIFTIIGVKENGEREILSSIEPVEGASGDKNVISMNEDGSKVTEKQVKGLFQINARSRTDGIAISLGSYGMMDIDYVQNVRDKETRRAIPIQTKEAENQRRTVQEVREQGGDTIEEMEKEGENFRAKQKEGMDPQSMDGIDEDLSDGKDPLEEVKRKIAERALDEGDMSSEELKEFIEGQIEYEGLNLTEGEREDAIKDISEEVLDDSRFPTMGEHHY